MAFTKEHRQHLKDAHKGFTGHKHTQATKDKIGEAAKGRKSGMTGKTHSQATKDQMSKVAMGKPKSPEACHKMSIAHTLDNPTVYSTLHGRVRKLRGAPSKCEVCGTTDENKRYEWANLDHKDYQDMSNYKRMCRSCHKKHDRKKGI